MNEKNQFGIDPESVVDFVINGETTSENPADTASPPVLKDSVYFRPPGRPP